LEFLHPGFGPSAGLIWLSGEQPTNFGFIAKLSHYHAYSAGREVVFAPEAL
jgi:hypothetical protein